MATIVGVGLIEGTSGDDDVSAGGGSDTVRASAGNDTVNGGGGYDFVEYFTHDGQVAVNLNLGLALKFGGTTTTDVLVDVEAATGSNHSDAMQGSSFNNILIGLAGDDTLEGLDGDDTLAGSGGNDSLDGGGGGDTAIYGGRRSDYLVTAIAGGFSVVDQRVGGDGTDAVVSVEFFQFADGTLGADDLLGGGAPTPTPVSSYAVAATAATAAEGAAGPTGTLVFTVARSGATDTAETVSYTLGGTATAGTDYAAPAGSVAFAAGETSRTIAIAATADSLAEGDETVVLTLVGATGGGQVSATPATGTIVDAAPATPMIHVSRGGVASQEPATVYSGPVSHLQYQYLGTAAGEVAVATASNDFVNLLGGDDAADGGAGDDVLDGGTGSNFLTGGAGRDVFFLDGRGGTTTWSTVTDWRAGEELSVWGWRPGVSRATWVDDDGTAGFRGVTMHGDLNGDGTIDTSVTWAGIGRAQVPTPVEFDGLLWFK